MFCVKLFVFEYYLLIVTNLEFYTILNQFSSRGSYENAQCMCTVFGLFKNK